MVNRRAFLKKASWAFTGLIFVPRPIRAQAFSPHDEAWMRMLSVPKPGGSPPPACTNQTVSYAGSSDGGNVASWWMGFEFTVGSSDITVCSLARYSFAGGSLTHTVAVFGVSGMLASAAINMSGVAAHTFASASVTPANLLHGQSYVLASDETDNSDLGFNYTTPTAIGGFITVNGAVLYSGGTPTSAGSFGTGSDGNSYSRLLMTVQ